jgi:hypothetical protein
MASFSQAQVRIGLKGGVNLANLNADGIDSKMKIAFNAGAIAKFSVTNAFSIQPEVLYSSQGTTLEEMDVKFEMNYINIPVMFQYNVMGFILETGPQLGILASAKGKADGQSEDIKDMFKSIDFSWGIGAGYQMSGSGLGITARYNIGLSDIAEEGGGVKVKNSVIQLGFFYMLGRPARN